MGCHGVGADRPLCTLDDCGRRAYVDAEHELLCHVCDSTFFNEGKIQCWQNMLGCSPWQRAKPLQDFLENPVLATLMMEFLEGDGWSLQCMCTRCKHQWLNEGWVCPVEYRRRQYLQILDTIFDRLGYETVELTYVEWDQAARCVHDMCTDEIPWDIMVLQKFASESRIQVKAEIIELYPDGDVFPED